MGRAPCCDKANVKRGPWSPEEDRQLREFVEKHGTGGNWISLPQKAGLRRCGKSCRLRWLNYLRPNIKLGDFNEDEDRIICSLVAAIGSRWSIIAAHLPRRTDNDIKNYWNTKLKKKLLLGLQTQHKMPQQPPPAPAPPLLPSTYSSVSAPTAADLEGIPIPPCFATLNHQNGGDVIFGGGQYVDMEMEKVPLGGKEEASWGPCSTGAKASVCAPSTRAWSLYHC